MLLDITLGEALKKLKKNRLILDEVLVPAEVPSVAHSPYRPGYDWLFAYERKLFRFLESWLEEFRYEMIGERGILSEAFSNAYCHGHKRDPSLSMRVKVQLGEQGLIVQVEDSGKGFDLRKIVNYFSKGKNYFNLAGNGLRLMVNSKTFGVFYNRAGNVFHLFYLFDGDITSLETIGISGERLRKTAHQASFATCGSTLGAKAAAKELRLIEAPVDYHWAYAAILADNRGNFLAAFNIDRDNIREVIDYSLFLLDSAEKLTRYIIAGKPTMVWVQSPQATYIISRDDRDKHVLVAFLEQDTNSALSQRYIAELFQFFHSSANNSHGEAKQHL